MKRITFLLAMIAGAASVSAQKLQEKDVPVLVKTSFQKQFPEAKNIKWEKEDGNYEAGFKKNETPISVVLNPSGNILETETAIAVNTLPAMVREYVSKKYPGKKIKEAASITDAKGVVTYEAEVDGKDVIFDNTGKFLKETKD